MQEFGDLDMVPLAFGDGALEYLPVNTGCLFCGPLMSFGNICLVWL